jgi:hypothetical protein
MTIKLEKVTLHPAETPLAYRVAEHLIKQDYRISDVRGMRCNEPRPHVIGILQPRETDETHFGLFPKTLRAFYVGTLWLDNERKGATPDKNWVLEAYGHNQAIEIMDTLEEIAKKQSVKIDIYVESNKPRYEMYPEDAR